MRDRTLLLFTVLFGVVGLLYSTRIGGASNALLTNMVSLLPPFLAFIYALRAAHTYKAGSQHSSALILVAYGLLLWFIGEASFFLFQFVFQIDPYPSIADVAFLGGYVLFWVGLTKEVRINKSDLSDVNQYIQFLIALIMAMLALAVLYFGVFLAFNPSDPLVNNLVAMSYGLGDLILIAPTLYVLKMAVDYRGGKLFYSWAMIMIALLLNLLGDVFFAVHREAYSAMEWPFNMVDIIWGLSYLLFAYGFYNTTVTLKELRKRLE